ncbi:SET and MYND domain-containing protein 4, partial [Armadillidium nasatum]
MKSKEIQTSKTPTADRSCQTNKKGFKEAEELFNAAKQNTSEEDKLKLVPSEDDTQSTLQADSSMQVAQQPQPSSEKDDSLARQVSTLHISGQSHTSSSKQESNLEDATASKSSCDKAYQKELCEQILKTDPLRGIGVSQIYFTQYCDDFCSRLGKLKLLEKSESEFLELNNDYDRIRYILKFEKLTNLKLKIAKCNSKSAEFASALEEEYNNCCHSQEIDTLNRGLTLINRSIQFTPDQKAKAVAAKRIASVYKYARGGKDIEEPDKNITKDLTTPEVSYGDVIIVEKPYVSVLSRGNFETHCNNCFKRFRSSIPCDTCSRVWFCSEECLKEAKAGFHSTECKVLHLLYDETLGRLPPLVFRTLLRLTWKNIKILRKSRKIDPRLPDSHPLHMEFNLEEKYSTDDYLTTYKLVTNARKRNFGDLFKSTIIAFYLCQCLKEVDFFKGEKVSSEDE